MAYRITFVILFLTCLSQSILLGQTLQARKSQLSGPQAIKTVDSLCAVAFEVKRSNINQAFSLIFKALNLAEENNYTKGTATALLYQGGIFQQTGFSKRALSLFYQSLSLSRKISDTFNVARASQQLANAYKESGDSIQAEKLFKEALKMYLSLNKLDEVVNIKNSLGLIYITKKDYSKAEKYFTEASSESSNNNYSYGHKKSLYNLGLLNLEKHNLRESESYIKQALEIDLLKNDKYGVALAKNKLAQIALEENNYEKSLELATESYRIADQISALQIELEAIDNITKAYEEKRDFKKLGEWNAVLIAHHKQLYEKERVYAVEFLDILDNQLKDQLAIEKQVLHSKQKVKETRSFLIVAGIALTILSALSYLLFIHFRRANKLSKALAKQNVLIEKNTVSLNQLNAEIGKKNEELQARNQMKDKLLSILSHDLRNPLSNTKGIISLINSGFVTAQEEKDLMVKLEEQYTRSLNLLDDLLLWVGSQVEGVKTELKKTELNELFTNLIEDQKVSLENKTIAIKNELDKELDVKGDKEMLKIIFRNLISNAIKFTRPGGSLKIYSTNSSGVNIHIEDNGIGMTEEELTKIDKKEYFTKTGTAKELGSGFGLRLSQDLIKIHGGSLSIKSQKDYGSTFTVTLPALS